MSTLKFVALLMLLASAAFGQCRPWEDPILGKLTCPPANGPAGPTGPTGPTGAAGASGFPVPTAQTVTSGVTTSVVIPLNGTLTDKSQALPSCTTSAGVGTLAWTSWTNTTTQMTIDFSGTGTAGFTGTCTAVPTIGPTGPTGPTGPAGSGGGMPGVIDVTASPYSCVGNGSTDNTSCINAAMAAAYAANGGVLWFPPGTYRVNSQILIPTNSGTPVAKMPPIRITGIDRTYGFSAGSTTYGSVLDLRYTGTGGRITGLGSGLLEVDHITIKDLSGSAANATPYFYITNTVLHAHDLVIYGSTAGGGTSNNADAFVLGGDNAGSIYDNTLNGSFGGYGAVIERVIVDYVRRFVWGRSDFNGVQVVNNMVWINSGSATGNSAAIDLSDTTGTAPHSGNYFAGNLIEGSYTYIGFCGTQCAGNTFASNNIFDETGLVAVYRFDHSSSISNMVIQSFGPSAVPLISETVLAVGKNVGLSSDPTTTTTWPSKWTFSKSVFGKDASNAFRATRNSAIDWGASPSSGADARLIQWDTNVMTLDNGTTRSFIPLRFGASYNLRPISVKTSNYSVSATDDHNTVFVNTSAAGEVDYALPLGSAALIGATFTFYVNTAQTVKVIASGSNIIQVAAVTSSAGGSAEASTIGYSLKLIYVSTGKWAAESVTGIWTVL